MSNTFERCLFGYLSIKYLLKYIPSVSKILLQLLYPSNKKNFKKPLELFNKQKMLVQYFGVSLYVYNFTYAAMLSV